MLNHGSKALLGLAGATMAFGLAACGGDDNKSDSGSSGSGDSGGSGKIALLLPESKTTRYESQDKPLFEAKVKELCSGCEVLYSNADQDASKQQQQAEAAITNGAKVLVLDPVDADSAGAIVKRAQSSNVKVVSYDRLIGGGSKPDYYISFDNAAVGKLQGDSLIEQLGGADAAKGKQIVMINGAPTDSNAKLFKQGAHSVLDGVVKIGKEYDTPDWSPDKAQDEMDQAITSLGKDKIDGVYAANDGTGGAAIAAMKAAGMDPTKIPSTGQDAELAGVQRVLAGEQGMTVYKAIKPEAEKAAELAVALVQGKEPAAGLITGKQNNDTADIPAIILTPVAVTKDNVKDTIVADGFWKVDELCTSAYADACKAAGISS